MRVLLVDDDELSREILSLLLEAEGWVVATAGSGEEAVEVLRSGATAEVVLADLKMPGLAGAELAAGVRGSGERAPQVLLAMSASEPARGATAGYDGFLRKPFTMGQFTDAVRGGGHSEVARVTETRDEGEAHTAEVLDEDKLVALRKSFTPAQIDELFRFALTDAERQLEMMQKAVAERDDALYRSCAHSMKGSFGMLGAPELRALATEAEEGAGGLTSQVTSHELFLGALSRLRHTLVARGIRNA